MTQNARSLWLESKRGYAIRNHPLPDLAEDHIAVAARFSGVSRGTERLVFNGDVPTQEWERMRAPFQEGTFPHPVKYGYSNIGEVTEGPSDLLGERVFCLYPHQDRFHVPLNAVHVLPHDLPGPRATLAANMETALNAVWDAGTGPGDRIAVIGAGVVGALIGYLCARLPGAQVTFVDPRDETSGLADAFGCHWQPPEALAGQSGADGTMDMVFHTSATPDGLTLALWLAGLEATVVEVSWYGAKTVDIGLGGSFHGRRLKLISSQVGHVSASRRARWTCRRRMAMALNLLADARLDALISEIVPFVDAPSRLPDLLNARASGHGIVLAYVAGDSQSESW